MFTTSPAASLGKGHVLRQLTDHAARQLERRRIPVDGVIATLQFGRVVHIRGAILYALGRKEMFDLKRSGIDIARHEGIHVVCGRDGAIMTVYRNRSMRDLRPHRRGRSYRFALTSGQKGLATEAA